MAAKKAKEKTITEETEKLKLQQEKFCHLFASEMLLSSENLLLEFGNHRNRVTFQETYIIQEKYGISFRAIVYKLEQNKIINKNKIQII